MPHYLSAALPNVNFEFEFAREEAPSNSNLKRVHAESSVTQRTSESINVAEVFMRGPVGSPLDPILSAKVIYLNGAEGTLGLNTRHSSLLELGDRAGQSEGSDLFACLCCLARGCSLFAPSIKRGLTGCRVGASFLALPF